MAVYHSQSGRPSDCLLILYHKTVHLLPNDLKDLITFSSFFRKSATGVFGGVCGIWKREVGKRK